MAALRHRTSSCPHAPTASRASHPATVVLSIHQQHYHQHQQHHHQHHQLQQHQRRQWRVSGLDPKQQPGETPPPWSLTFDLRERETVWTEENKARLVALVAAQQLSIPMAEMEQRLDALVLLVPDLAGGIQRLQPALLASLTADLQLTTSRILGLRELLPTANVSSILASRPQLLLQDTSELKAAVATLQQQLQLEHVDRLVEAQPLFLVPECVQQVLDELRRLMPQANAAQLLSQDPDWLLRLQRGQQWLGLHPDSQMGELVDWQPPNGQ